MTRRDTIIVAVLVNTGLLIILFASALKSPSSGEIAAAPIAVTVEKQDFVVTRPVSSVASAPVDEVDKALQAFDLGSQPSSPAPVANFVEDLKFAAAPEPKEVLPKKSSQEKPSVVTQGVPDFVEVKVKKGDVLEKIARHHHSTVAEIMKANQLTSAQLQIGQVLRVPQKNATSTTPVVAARSETRSEAKYYTVKKGDSPWTIAVKHHLKVEELLKLNQMSEAQARHLKPGDQLRIQ